MLKMNIWSDIRRTYSITHGILQLAREKSIYKKMEHKSNSVKWNFVYQFLSWLSDRTACGRMRLLTIDLSIKPKHG